MFNYKKTIIASVIILFALIIGIIWLQSSESYVYYEEPVAKCEIRLFSDWNSVDSIGKSFQQMVSDFNGRNDDVIVLNDVQSREDYYTRLKLDFASDNEPDIFLSWPGQIIEKYVDMEKIAYFNDYLNGDEAWYESFDQSVWRYVSHNGKIYGLPIENICVNMYMNKTILKECGLKIPYSKYGENDKVIYTYEEFRHIVEVLKEKGYIPIAFDLSENGLLLYKAIVARLGGKFCSAEIKNGDEFNPNFIEACEYLKELYSMGAFAENLFSITENERDNAYLEGKAAFIVQDSHFLNRIYLEKPELYGETEMCVLPKFEGQLSRDMSAIYGLSSNTMFVSKRAMENPEKEEKILRFLKYMTSVDSAGYMKNELGAVTAVEPNLFISNRGATRRNTDFVYSLSETVAFPNYYTEPVWANMLDRLPGYLEGKITVTDLLN